MNTQYLQYAIEVHKAGSITKAAQNLYMAQPNLSKAIKELEEMLGYEIFERRSKGMKASPKGEIFLKYAKNIVRELEIVTQISKEFDKDVLKFRISMPRGSYIAHGVANFLSTLDQSMGMDISILETNSLETIEKVVEGQYQLGIIRYQASQESYWFEYLKSNGLSYEMLWEFEYMVVLGKNHPLAEYDTIREEDLNQYIEVSHGDTEVPYIGKKRTNNLRKEADKKIYVYERGSQFDLLTKVPNTFMWVSAIPESYLRQFNLVTRSCKVDDNQYKDVLIYKEGYEFTNLDRIFKRKVLESKLEVAGNLAEK
ncbi:MAG: LysR family transcriptional regulator [Eubacteriales bacterium]